MKITLAELQSINRSLPAITQQPLPVKLSYRLSKLISFCTKEMEIVEKARADLVKKYSEEDDTEKNVTVRVKPENEQKFRDEFSELLSEEIELDFDPINLDDLGNVKITPIDLFRLSKIIKEES